MGGLSCLHGGVNTTCFPFLLLILLSSSFSLESAQICVSLPQVASKYSSAACACLCGCISTTRLPTPKIYIVLQEMKSCVAMGVSSMLVMDMVFKGWYMADLVLS